MTGTWRAWLLAAGMVVSVVAGAPVAAPPVLVASPEAGWPQFRGPRRDGVSLERGLLPSWPEGGPTRLWSAKGLGQGFSSPVIGGGRLYLTGDVGEELQVMAFDLAGQLLWRTVNGRSWRKDYPGARSSVTLSAGRVYHQNAHGRVACLDAASGRELWAVELLARFGGRNLTWGLSECLVVDEGVVYATAGGREALLVALDAVTGAVRWRSAPLRDAEGGEEAETAGYASPILLRYAGRRLLVGVSLRHLYCADADTGQLQWTRRRPTSYSVQAMMPLLVGDGVFMTAPYGLPGRLYRLTPPATPDGLIGVEEGWETPLDTCQGGAVVVDGRIYGSYYTPRKGWAAVDVADGRVLHGRSDLAKGAVLAADQRLYALAEDGWMLLLEPAAQGLEVRGRFRLAEARGRDAWAHPVVHEGRLYLRYHDTLSCFDIRAPAP